MENEGMSLLICKRLAGPNSSTIILSFHVEGDAPIWLYAVESLIAMLWDCERKHSGNYTLYKHAGSQENTHGSILSQ